MFYFFFFLFPPFNSHSRTIIRKIWLSFVCQQTFIQFCHITHIPNYYIIHWNGPKVVLCPVPKFDRAYFPKSLVIQIDLTENIRFSFLPQNLIKNSVAFTFIIRLVYHWLCISQITHSPLFVGILNQMPGIKQVGMKCLLATECALQLIVPLYWEHVNTSFLFFFLSFFLVGIIFRLFVAYSLH